MAKALLTEDQLISAINLALDHGWPHKNHACRVLGLKKVDLPERNWEVAISEIGGVDLLKSSECERKLKRVLDEVVPKYDVAWP